MIYRDFENDFVKIESAQCSKGICQISGPLDFYAEAYVRAQLLGFNMDACISGSESAGVKTITFKNPINLL